MSEKVYDKDLEKVSGGFGQEGKISDYLNQIQNLVDNSSKLFQQITGDIIVAILSVGFQPNPKAKLSEVINQINILIGTNPSEKEMLEQLKTLVGNIIDYLGDNNS